MYSNTMLPEVIEGKWIWHDNGTEGDFDRLFLKQDFSLYEMPGVAEMWVASHLFFTIFINGRPCTAGPIPNPGSGKNAYAMRVDITHMIDVGVNHIFIMAHKENTSLAGVRNSVEGIWLQVNIDNKPVVCTDENWICQVPGLYRETGLLTAPCGPFTEYVDFQFNSVELESEVMAVLRASRGKYAWKNVDYVHEPDQVYGVLEPFDQIPTTPEIIHSSYVPFKGKFKQSCESLWVSFAEAISTMASQGLYIAETYVYCPPGETVETLLICDEPYMLYVNGDKVKEQAVPPLPLRMNPAKSRRSEKLTLEEFETPNFKMVLESGWNHIRFAQECQTKTSGAVFIWPDLPVDALQCRQEPSFDAENGWVIVGPVSTPMRLLYSSFPFDELVKYKFNMYKCLPNDISALYLASSFKASETNCTLELPLELSSCEYAIVDFEKTHFSYPLIKISGRPGDIVDIVCGENCQNGELMAYEIGFRRNTTTIVLGSGEVEWISSTPRGLRYMMIVVRKSADKVSISDVCLWQETMEHSAPGEFQCSSPTLEAVWKTGVRTLDTTMQRIFLDSPTKDQAQSLPDAMIQSWAAYYVYGEYDRVGRALEEFAKSQLETGDLNALSPSGLYQALPDYSLTWPTWLQRHYLHTGDSELLAKLMPVLQKLMYFYNEIAVEPDGPLGDLQEYQGVYAFLDHGYMDREGISTGLNAIYCRALFSAAWLAGQADLPELESLYKERAAMVAAKVWSLCWDDKRKIFADSCHANGIRSGKCSWQSNVLAIYGGIAKPQHYASIWSKLFSDEAPLELMAGGEYNNPYFKYYVLEAAFALGKSPWGLSLIHYYWGKMLKAGAITWWEMFDPDKQGEQNRLCAKCQGYGVSPNCYLISELVGIRPAEPGMRMVYFNPTPGDVSWVKASIPTPLGYITVHWKMLDNGIFDVNISANYLVEVIPILDPAIAKQANFTVSDKVSILAPE